MNTELTPLVHALTEIAHDAGCALLFPVDVGTTRRYAARYNGLCRQLSEVAPCATSFCTPLPEDATPGSIRIAARMAVAYARETAPHCFQRTAP